MSTRENNAVFGAPQSGGSQSALDYDIPVELIPLPSNGTVYTGPLQNVEAIQIKAMTAKEEDILTSRALIKNGTVITKLIESCMTDRGIDVRSMLQGDRNALMVGIRITGYGHEYGVETTCPICEETQETTFDLSQLPIKRLEVEPTSPGENKFDFRLPVSGKSVTFKFLTGHDEEEINRISDRKKRKGIQVDSLVTTKLLYSIVAVDGVVDRQEIARFVSRMPARDSKALRNHIDNSEPGIIMEQEVVCQHCGEIADLDMPLGVNFFWPSS